LFTAERGALQCFSDHIKVQVAVAGFYRREADPADADRVAGLNGSVGELCERNRQAFAGRSVGGDEDDSECLNEACEHAVYLTSWRGSLHACQRKNLPAAKWANADQMPARTLAVRTRWPAASRPPMLRPAFTGRGPPSLRGGSTLCWPACDFGVR